MNNKVLVRLISPQLDHSYDVFIPVNELVWKVTKLLVKSISDLSGINLDINENYLLINQQNGKVYQNNDIIRETDIRNTTELILLSNKG